VPSAIHHSVVVVRDLDTSLRFYRDGLGLDVLLDREVEGDWPSLFDGPSRKLRAVFLGDATVPDVTAGVLELKAFVGGNVPTGYSPSHPTTGFFMLSYSLTWRRLSRGSLIWVSGVLHVASPRRPLAVTSRSRWFATQMASASS
jgi:catechol 2,3-dioxygenase-like lactoylglutathione lyase family enzyme